MLNTVSKTFVLESFSLQKRLAVSRVYFWALGKFKRVRAGPYFEAMEKLLLLANLTADITRDFLIVLTV